MKGFNEKAVEETLERMKILPMIPLEIDKDKSTTKRTSAIDKNYEIYNNTMSNYSQTLEYGNRSKDVDPYDFFFRKPSNLQNEIKHTITSYTPLVHTKTSDPPDPTTYSPDYKATAPTAPKYTISPLPSNQPRKIVNATTSDIISRYSNNMRNFDPNKISNISDQTVTTADVNIPDHRIYSTFERQLNRNTDLAQIKDGTHVDSHFPTSTFSQSKLKKSIFDFSSMTSHVDRTKIDSGRDYTEKADQQFKKIIDKSHKTPNFHKQLSRDYQPKKNSRVEFLDGLSMEQSVILQKLRSTRSKSSAFNSYNQESGSTKTQNISGKESSSTCSRNVSSSFQKQISRDTIVPQQLRRETFPESKYHLNPGKNLKKVMPQVPAPTIREIPKRQNDNFWSPY